MVVIMIMTMLVVARDEDFIAMTVASNKAAMMADLASLERVLTHQCALGGAATVWF